jgi:DNA-binding transcriptional LysR family regulator
VGLDLFKLRVFVTVVDRGGYSATAEHLGLAQSTVSFHVRSLEQRYAVPLMPYEHRAVGCLGAGLGGGSIKQRGSCWPRRSSSSG